MQLAHTAGEEKKMTESKWRQIFKITLTKKK